MGGRRIDDHNSWMGKGDAMDVLPPKTKCKSLPESGGAGALSQYRDTIETSTEDQRASVSKIQGHKIKPGYRN